MEVIRLSNPNINRHYEAYIIEMEGKGYLQVKNLFIDQEVFSGIYKSMEELTNALIVICEANNLNCKPLSKTKQDSFTGFEPFFEVNDN
jgi:hypothetical protein